MTTSKIFKKESGDRYEVKLSLYTDSYSSRFHWDISVYCCPAGKRKFVHLNCQDDWQYRKLDMREREEYYKQFLLSHIPAEWVTEVQREILEELSKPVLG